MSGFAMIPKTEFYKDTDEEAIKNRFTFSHILDKTTSTCLHEQYSETGIIKKSKVLVV